MEKMATLWHELSLFLSEALPLVVLVVFQIMAKILDPNDTCKSLQTLLFTLRSVIILVFVIRLLFALDLVQILISGKRSSAEDQEEQELLSISPF
jgi:hypothetical protein